MRCKYVPMVLVLAAVVFAGYAQAAEIKFHCEDLHRGQSGNPWCYSLQLQNQQEFFKYLMAYKGLPFLISKSSAVTCRDRFVGTPW